MAAHGLIRTEGVGTDTQDTEMDTFHTYPSASQFTLDQGKNRFCISDGKSTWSFPTLTKVAEFLPERSEIGFERSLAGGGNKALAGEIYNKFLDALCAKHIIAYRCSTRALKNSRKDAGAKCAADLKTDERDARDLWPIFYVEKGRRKLAKRWVPTDPIFDAACKELDARLLAAKNNGWEVEKLFLRKHGAKVSAIKSPHKSAVVVAQFVKDHTSGTRREFDRWSGLTEYGRPSTHRAALMYWTVKKKAKVVRKDTMREVVRTCRAIFALVKYGALGGADTRNSETDTKYTRRPVPSLFTRKRHTT